MTWYNRLLGTIEISGSGIVSRNLETILDNALFQKLPVVSDLDASLTLDITQWFETVFNPWFASLSASLTVENDIAQLTSPRYTTSINEVITALFIARAYYAKVADGEFTTSLKNVGLFKVAICEEIAKSLSLAFEEALKQYGNTIEGKTMESTIASIYTGSTPENFIWNGNVLVNHVKYENIQVMGDPNQNQSNCSGEKQYLPWVFCAAFGLIAWASAAKESKQQQRSSNK